MRVGIIGCGNIAQVHAYALQHIESVEIAAFSDCNRDKAQTMSVKYTDGNAAVFCDYIEMLESVKPDVVHICTPHYLHVPMAIEALKRNISVFIEKPPAISKKEFDSLYSIASNSKGRIGFCFQNRYNPSTLELDRIVVQKHLGEVIGARAFVTWKRDARYYSDDWHGSLEKEGGGALINQAIHSLDLLLRYLGTPQTVEASMQNHHLKGVAEVEDTIEAWMTFDNGKRACFYATTAYITDAPTILELTFENGRATLTGNMIQVQEKDFPPKILLCESTEKGIGKSYWGNGHVACIKDFYSCLQTGQDFRNDCNGVRNTLYTTMRIYDSARENGKERNQ